MKQDNFDEMLTEALKEYVKDTEINSEDVPKVKFSERHKRNMEEIFAAVENGTLGNFNLKEDDEVSDQKDLDKSRSKMYYFYRFSKVAIWILLGLVALLVAAPSMTAWRSEDTEFYGENQDDYAWLLRNNTTEILESNDENSGEYMNLFGYLPEGFEVKNVIYGKDYERIEIKNSVNETIDLKIIKNVNRAVDMEDENEKIIYINEIEVKYTKVENKNVFFWNYNNVEYHLYSEIDFEILCEILKNIKY